MIAGRDTHLRLRTVFFLWSLIKHKFHSDLTEKDLQFYNWTWSTFFDVYLQPMESIVRENKGFKYVSTLNSVWNFDIYFFDRVYFNSTLCHLFISGPCRIHHVVQAQVFVWLPGESGWYFTGEWQSTVTAYFFLILNDLV